MKNSLQFILILLLTLLPLGKTPQAEPPSREKFCKNIVGNYGCAKVLETEWLKLLPERVMRKGNDLIINIDDGSKIKRVSNPSDDHVNEYYDKEGNVNAKYFVTDLLKEQGYLVLEIFYYETILVELINMKNGSSTIIDGRPNLSPDKGRLFTIEHDIGLPRTLKMEIWVLGPNEVIKEFSLTPKNWPWVKPVWRSETKIEIEMVEDFLIKPPLGIKPGDTITNITFKDGQWVVE